MRINLQNCNCDQKLLALRRAVRAVAKVVAETEYDGTFIFVGDCPAALHSSVATR